jgi:hypothetical protein
MLAVGCCTAEKLLSENSYDNLYVDLGTFRAKFYQMWLAGIYVQILLRFFMSIHVQL